MGVQSCKEKAVRGGRRKKKKRQRGSQAKTSSPGKKTKNFARGDFDPHVMRDWVESTGWGCKRGGGYVTLKKEIEEKKKKRRTVTNRCKTGQESAERRQTLKNGVEMKGPPRLAQKKSFSGKGKRKSSKEQKVLKRLWGRSKVGIVRKDLLKRAPKSKKKSKGPMSLRCKK